jgi:hypothetical protein
MWNLEFFHTLHLCGGRTLPEHTFEFRQCLILTRRDHLHRPVTQVAGEATESQTRRLSPHPPAEPHSLHATMDEEAHGGHAAYPCRLCAARRRCHQTYTIVINASTGSTTSSARPV